MRTKVASIGVYVLEDSIVHGLFFCVWLVIEEMMWTIRIETRRKILLFGPN